MYEGKDIIKSVVCGSDFTVSTMFTRQGFYCEIAILFLTLLMSHLNLGVKALKLSPSYLYILMSQIYLRGLSFLYEAKIISWLEY